MAKLSKPKQNTTPEPVGIPLAGTKADKRLLQALKDDIAPEATPALQFVTEHARVISAIVVGIVLIAVIGIGYKWYHKSTLEDGRMEIAAALQAGDADKVIAALEKAAPALPEELQLSAYSEIVMLAEELKNHDKAAEYWRKIYEGSAESGYKTVAGLGLAKNLVALQKQEEAEKLLDALAASAGESLLPQVQMERAVLAEQMGNYQKSLEIYQVLQSGENIFSKTFLAAQVEALGKKLKPENEEQKDSAQEEKPVQQ
ncbi:MAG: hypothetical protein IJD04_03110 [Desulfovibrionaceae bacterium]|nr:hypothetical protein [Desulfovibrionaceae bacterium]